VDHGRLAGVGRQHDFVAGREHHAAGLDVAEAQLRPLQVAQDGQRLTLIAGHLAHHCHRLGVGGVVAVGEVDTGDSHARGQHAADGLAVGRTRPNRCYDFRARHDVVPRA